MQLRGLPVRPESQAGLLSNHSYVMSGPGWCHEKRKMENCVCRISRMIARLPQRWLQNIKVPKMSSLDVSSQG